MIEREAASPRPLPGLSAGVLAPASSVGKWVTRFTRTKPLGAIGGAITIILILIAVFAPVIAPYGPKEQLGRENVHLGPQFAFPMGTDHVGRDVLSRVVHGARISLYVGFGSVIIGMVVGSVLALTTTYAGKYVDLSFQRLVDAMMALPGLIIALAVVAVLGSSLQNVIIAIVLGMLAPVVRTVRAQVLTLKELDYVLAARAIGASSNRIMFRHIAPNCVAIILVIATYYLGLAITIEASLSFLGVGVPPDVASWGGMLKRAAEEHVRTAPWVAIFPGMAIFVVVFGFNLLGDALRDVFDPKLRQR
ncbi:MAG: ABC transporter permease [Chloroflexi bacterium]|nr:ABC transporter permease [Chloroflexota bacterium]